MGQDIDKGLSAAQMDFRQLQEELTGAAGGRLLRFLTPEMYEALRADLRSEKREAHYSKLVTLLLTNALYRETYERVWNKLEDYERRAEQALDRIRKRMVELEAELETLRSRAGRLPNRTRVYRDQNGAVRTEDGTEVSGPELEAVIWPEHATTYEQIAAPGDELASLIRDEQAVEHYQVEIIGGAKNRLEDEDNPLAQEDIVALERRIELIAPNAVSQDAVASGLSEQAPARAAIAIPKP